MGSFANIFKPVTFLFSVADFTDQNLIRMIILITFQETFACFQIHLIIHFSISFLFHTRDMQLLLVSQDKSLKLRFRSNIWKKFFWKKFLFRSFHKTFERNWFKK